MTTLVHNFALMPGDVISLYCVSTAQYVDVTLTMVDLPRRYDDAPGIIVEGTTSSGTPQVASLDPAGCIYVTNYHD